MTHVNQPVSWSRQNFETDVWSQTTGQLTSSMKIADLQSPNGTLCSCAIDPTCKQPQGFFERESFLDAYNATVFIPGFFAACFPVESLLQSTLECFYSPGCLKTIQSYVTKYLSANQTIIWDFTALDPNISSRFLPNTTVEVVVNNLFVESWSPNISYALYYSNCRPLSCTYTAMERPTIVAVFTRVVSLFGGLSVTLRLIIPFVIEYLRRSRAAADPDNSQLAGKIY